MFNILKELIASSKYKNNMIKEFMKVHEKYLPCFSPHGQPLEWDISVFKTGDYDPFTGKQDGEYKISVVQINPHGIMCDEQAYRYNIETKSLEAIKGCHWR